MVDKSIEKRNRNQQSYDELKQYVRELELKVEALQKSNDRLIIKKAEFETARDTLKKNEEKFQAIFDNSPLAIMYTDENGVITTCNNRATKLFGAPRERLIGFSYKNIKNKAMKAAIATALSGEKSRFEGEYLTVTGNVLTNMNANFSPAFFPDGSVSGVIGIFEDITERIQIEKEREKLLGELQKALAEVKQLSGFLPICASCKKIRDDNGYWNQIEAYIRAHSNAQFSHSICPACAKKLYPGFYEDD
ncbi:MAG: PAS domain S-box protein [Thermodesulfobacteriota bacterium]